MTTVGRGRGLRIFAQQRQRQRLVSISNICCRIGGDPFPFAYDQTPNCPSVKNQKLWPHSHSNIGGYLNLRKLISPGKLKLESIARRIHTTVALSRRINYYGILGLTKKATAKEIKVAYYKMAKLYHPDTNKKDPDCQRIFQEVSEAYEVLSDKTKRQEYDTYGATSEQIHQEQSKKPPSSDNDEEATDPRGFTRHWRQQSSVNSEEMFRRIFGDYSPDDRNPFEEEYMSEFAQSVYGYGYSREIGMTLTFEEAATGATKSATLNVVDKCPKCRGTKCEIGTCPVKCGTCEGTGVETMSKGEPFIFRTACRDCNGQKVIIRDPCVECQGVGTMVLRKRVSFPVPPGVEDGQTIRIQILQKDVFVTFKVLPSTYFRRDDLDIHTETYISISQAILGGSSRIQGLYENLTVEIPAGSSSHNILKLKGKGIKHPNGQTFGDHLIHLRMQIPGSLSSVQEEVFKAYAETERDTPGTIKNIDFVKAGGDNPSKQGPKKNAKSETPAQTQASQESNGIFTKLKRFMFR